MTRHAFLLHRTVREALQRFPLSEKLEHILELTEELRRIQIAAAIDYLSLTFLNKRLGKSSNLRYPWWGNVILRQFDALEEGFRAVAQFAKDDRHVDFRETINVVIKQMKSMSWRSAEIAHQIDQFEHEIGSNIWGSPETITSSSGASRSDDGMSSIGDGTTVFEIPPSPGLEEFSKTISFSLQPIPFPSP
ncbi:hypothetical protein BT69DRAFT_1279604 [Atractiella rhizophila]|nr:hypothetical protein BT69DRAFT_1279604 [Atractiella rhizophila]